MTRNTVIENTSTIMGNTLGWVMCAWLAIGCGGEGDGGLESLAHHPEALTVADDDPLLVGAADITLCSNLGDESTANLLDSILADHPSASVFSAGDNSNGSGTDYEYTDCYDPAWGATRR
ncbi:hypothetical protein ACFL5O_04705 [Myxococcota bacterium]